MTRDIARKPCLVHRDPERRISHVQDHRHHRSRQRLSFVSADPVHTFPLVEAIARAEQQIGRAPARLFHLAVPPAAFEPTVTMLGAAGLARGSRVIIEKPFGTDLASARALNATVHAHFDDSQIFRIDHFLGKESVDNILAFPVRQRPVRAGVEPQAHRLRADRRARDPRDRGARGFL
jgi:glucose-6-phosphate 1-dehydrogenase